MGKNNREDFQLNGLLDKGCNFEGKLTFDGTVQINGDFKGDILSDGTLIVGSEARISARIQVSALVVDGSVEGVVEAKQKIELRHGGKLVANITTPAIVIEDGATFHGQCQMLTESAVHDRMERAATTQKPLLVDEGEDALIM